MRRNLILYLLWMILLESSSDSPAYVLNDHHSQLISSTSLKWVRSSGGRRPLNSVMCGSLNGSSLFVCRHILGGSRYEPGVLTWESCIGIPSSTSRTRERIYEVLVNVDGASRLEWANWTRTKDSRLPIGAVSISGRELFAARSHDADFGTLYFKDSLGIATYITTLKNTYLQIGQVLVEHTALLFEIRNFRRGALRSVHRDHVVLPHPIHVVVNGSSENKEEDQVYDYEVPNYLYFGSSGHGIPRGAAIQMYLEGGSGHNGSRVPLTWGSPLNLTRLHKLRLSYKVPPFTRLRVDVKAVKLAKKYEFSATVVSHFRDGAILMRGIRGVYKHVKFMSFRPIFGQPIRLARSRNATASAPTTKTYSTAPFSSTVRPLPADNMETPTEIQFSGATTNYALNIIIMFIFIPLEITL